jgi:hypothetical protein
VYRDYPHAEDYELWVRLLRRCRGGTLPEPLVLYREHVSSVSSENASSQLSMVDRISAEQVGRLLPLSAVAADGMDRLRRIRRGQVSGAPEDLGAVRLMLDLFEAFSREPGIDAPRVARLERRWVGLVLERAQPGAWAGPGRDVAATLWRRAPGAAARGVVASQVRRWLRRTPQEA